MKQKGLILLAFAIGLLFGGILLNTTGAGTQETTTEAAGKDLDSATSIEINGSRFLTKSGEIKYFKTSGFDGSAKDEHGETYDDYFIPICYVSGSGYTYLAYAADTKLVYIISKELKTAHSNYYLSENLNYCRYNVETNQIEEIIKE